MIKGAIEAEKLHEIIALLKTETDMTAKITVIVDNNGNTDLQGEWGLSVLVEYSGKKILLDAGQSGLFLENMKGLGIDVGDIDYATLSHAHYDHANGFMQFLDNNEKAKLYLREGTDKTCYKKAGWFHAYIGIPKKLIKSNSDRIEMVSGDYELIDGVYLIPHKTPGLGEIGRRERMYQKTKHGWIFDDFSHEQSLVLDTDKGLVILNSCSHGGVANIINEVKETFPDKQVYGYLGGMHLFNKTEEEIRKTAEEIRKTGIRYVCTGHCTGGRAFSLLQEELGDTICRMKVGYRVTF